MQMLQESSISGLTPVAALALPVIRNAWPKIGVKEAFPTEVAKTPKITIPHLIPYIMDDDGIKHELPAAFNRTSMPTSLKALKNTAIALPAKNVDIMPDGLTVAAGYRPDPVLSVASVVLSVTTAAGADAQNVTVTVPVSNGRMDTRQDSIRFTVSAKHPTDGHVTSDTVYGYVDRENGLINLSSINASAASASAAHAVSVVIKGRVETTLNRQSTHIGYDIRTRDIDIGTGEHYDSAVPYEWLTDNMANYGIDGQLKVIDLLTDTVAQKTDIEGVNFIIESYDSLVAQSIQFTNTFDVFPTGNYMGSPSEWRKEIHRTIDNMAHRMRNEWKFTGGHFVIVGNPIDTDLIDGVTWTIEDSSEVDGVEVSYKIGAQSRANSYKILASQTFDVGALYMFYIPSRPDNMTYKYFPYTFDVRKTSEGFVNPNSPNTPGIMVTNRQKFFEFSAMVGKIIIENNNGDQPA
jgi:hypothetical protein